MVAPPLPRHHLIITGTGRTGTTFLVRLLTELGLDTGYSRHDWRRDYSSYCDAGLENHLADGEAAPYVVKTPDFCVTLPRLLAEGRIAVDHAVIPVRDLDEATSSRLRVGGTDGSIPGGLLATDDPARQKAVLAERFHQLIHTLTAHEIPHTFLLFPRLVVDADYTHTRLAGLLPGVSREQFRKAFARLADPAKVHHFAPARPVTPDPAIAADHAARQRRRRLRQRVRRAAGWIVAGLALASIAAQVVAWRRGQEPAGASATTGAPRTPPPSPPVNFQLPSKAHSDDGHS